MFESIFTYTALHFPINSLHRSRQVKVESAFGSAYYVMTYNNMLRKNNVLHCGALR